MIKVERKGAVLLISLGILFALLFGSVAVAAGLPDLPDLSLTPLMGDELKDQALLEAREKLAVLEQRYKEITKKMAAQQADTLDAQLTSTNDSTAAFSNLFSGGSGTTEEPYIITTADQLNAVRNGLDACYRLGGDIDLSNYGAGYDGGKGWQPIGSDSQPFIGTLDGNGYKVTNLFISRPGEVYIGLFGYSSGVIKNLRLEHTVAGPRATAVGGLVGENDGNIENCYSTGSVSGGSLLGGLAGENSEHATIRRSFSAGTVTVDDDGFYAGGLVGENYGTIELCYSTSSVSVSVGFSIGGLVGQNWNTIQKCYSTGDIHIPGDGFALATGGLAGDTQEGTIENCYSTGNIKADGLALYTGGLVGYIYNSTIENCYSTGDVAGGFIQGGLVGANDNGAIVQCYYEDDAINGLGTSKTTAEMMQRSTFTNWDFDSIWGIMEGATFPFLRPLAVMIIPSNAEVYVNEGDEVTALSGIVYTRSGVSLEDISAPSGEVNYSGSGPWNFDLVFDTLDGPNTFSTTVTAVDEYVYANTAVYNIIVENLSPTPSISGAPASSISEGAAVTLTASATDPSDADTTAGFTYEWLVNGVSTGSGSSFIFTPADNVPYTIKLKATDKDGGTGETSVSIVVDNVPPTPTFTGAPEQGFINQEANFGAAFTDPAGALDETYTATWDWGDGTQTNTPGVIYAAVLNAGHTYTTPGFYTIKLTITDKDGGSNEATHLFRVIDKSLSCTGTGLFTSPPDAVAAQPGLSGPATFQLSSAYLMGKNTPSGLVSFQFLKGKLLFLGTSQEWLCIADNNIWLKGKGTLNGRSGYSYLLSGVDEFRIDSFRMQIWDKSGHVVYDNEPGAELYAAPNTPLSKGAVIIKSQRAWR